MAEHTHAPWKHSACDASIIEIPPPRGWPDSVPWNWGASVDIPTWANDNLKMQLFHALLLEDGDPHDKIEAFQTEAAANAAHIVHCVNTYPAKEARIKELEAALWAQEHLYVSGILPPPVEEIARVHALRRAALASQKTPDLVGNKVCRPLSEDKPAPVNGESEELRAALKGALGWVRHWQADVAGNLKPTMESLLIAEQAINAALSKREGE